MPPRIINQSQQVQAGIILPPALYSRVFGIIVTIPADGDWHYAVSPTVGRDVWLKHIWIIRDRVSANVANSTNYELMTGTTKLRNINDFANWDRIIRIQNDGDPTITQHLHDGVPCADWYMNRPYRGQSRRFGILAKRIGQGQDQMEVTFEVSEG